MNTSQMAQLSIMQTIGFIATLTFRFCHFCRFSSEILFTFSYFIWTLIYNWFCFVKLAKIRLSFEWNDLFLYEYQFWMLYTLLPWLNAPTEMKKDFNGKRHYFKKWINCQIQKNFRIKMNEMNPGIKGSFVL